MARWMMIAVVILAGTRAAGAQVFKPHAGKPTFVASKAPLATGTTVKTATGNPIVVAPMPAAAPTPVAPAAAPRPLPHLAATEPAPRRTPKKHPAAAASGDDEVVVVDDDDAPKKPAPKKPKPKKHKTDDDDVTVTDDE